MEAGAGVNGAGGADGTRSAYGAALRHSRRVTRLKILLPVLALVISLAFIAVSWVATMLPAGLTIGGVRIENGKIVMERPAISGRNLDGVGYYMNARRALQDIRNPHEITFEDIEAAVPVNGDVVARFTAKSGVFDRAKDRLDMADPFAIHLNTGLEVLFQSAHIDAPKGFLKTTEPVSIRAKQASIVAQSLEITDKGRIITFKGNVKVTINPEPSRSSLDKAQK